MINVTISFITKETRESSVPPADPIKALVEDDSVPFESNIN